MMSKIQLHYSGKLAAGIYVHVRLILTGGEYHYSSASWSNKS